MATIGTLVARISGDTSGLRLAERESKSYCTSIARSLQGLKRAAIAAFTGWGIHEVGRSFLGITNEFTRFRITIQTLERDIAAGNAKWKELLHFAEKTPFTIKQVMQGYIQLKAYGIEPTIRTMTALGDAVAVTGGQSDAMYGLARAIGQIQTTGKITALDLQQLGTYGINAGKAMEEAFGITRNRLRDLRKEGITSHQIIEALFQYIEKEFGGQMNRLFDTLAGRWEEFVSIIQRIQYAIMQAGPEEAITKALRKMSVALEEMESSGKLLEWINDVASTLVFLIVTVGHVAEALSELWGVAKAIPGSFIDYFKRAKKEIEKTTDEVDRQRGSYENLVNYMDWLGRTTLAAFKFMLKETCNFFTYVLSAIVQFVKGASKWLYEWGNLLVGVFTVDKEKIIKAWKRIWDGVLDETLKGVDANVAAFEQGAKESWGEYVKVYGGIPDLVGPVERTADVVKNAAKKAGDDIDALGASIDAIYQKLKDFLAIHSQADVAARETTALEIKYERMRTQLEMLKDAGKDVTEMSKQLKVWYTRSLEEIAERSKESSETVIDDWNIVADDIADTAEDVSAAWSNAFNRISDSLADWIETGKFSLEKFFDWIKSSLAQAAATKITGSVANALGLPGARAWAGVEPAGIGQPGGGIGDIMQLGKTGSSLTKAYGAYRDAGGGWGGLKAGMGNYFGFSGGGASAAAEMIPITAGDWAGMAGEYTSASVGEWAIQPEMSQLHAGELLPAAEGTPGVGQYGFVATAGALGYKYLGGALGLPQGPYSSIGAGAGAMGGMYLGGQLGSIGGPIGAIIGAAIGGILSSFIGSNKKRSYLGREYTFGRYGSKTGWGVPSMVEYKERREGEEFREAADQMATSGVELLNAIDSLFKEVLGSFEGTWRQKFELEMGKIALETPLAFDFYISAEDKKEFKADWKKSWVKLAKGAIDPVVDVGSALLEEALTESVGNTNVWDFFTADFKKYLAGTLEQSLEGLSVDWGALTKEEELTAALEGFGIAAENVLQIFDHFKTVEGIFSEISEALVMREFSAGTQTLIQSLRGINTQFTQNAAVLEVSGVDLQKYTELQEAYHASLEDVIFSVSQAEISGTDLAEALRFVGEEMQAAEVSAEELANASLAVVAGIVRSIEQLKTLPTTTLEDLSAKYGLEDLSRYNFDDWVAFVDSLGGLQQFSSELSQTLGAVQASEVLQDLYRLGLELKSLSQEAPAEQPIEQPAVRRDVDSDTSQAYSQFEQILAAINEVLETDGLSDYELAIRSLNQKYDEYKKQLLAAGHLTENIASLTRAYNIELERLNKAEAERIRTATEQIMGPLKELIATVGMPEHELAIRSLNARYLEYIYQLKALGTLTENATDLIAAYNIELDRINATEAERLQQEAERSVIAARDALIAALQREIETYQNAQTELQNAFETARSAYIAGLQEEIDIKKSSISVLRQTVDTFDTLLDSIMKYRQELVTTTGALSPQQQYKAAGKFFSEAVQGLYSGDQERIQKSLEELPGFGKTFLDASLAANADFQDYMTDFAKVQAALNTAGDIGNVQKTIAQRSLDQLQNQTDLLQQTVDALENKVSAPLATLAANYFEAKRNLETSVYPELIDMAGAELAVLERIAGSLHAGVSVEDARTQYRIAQQAFSDSTIRTQALGADLKFTTAQAVFEAREGYSAPGTNVASASIRGDQTAFCADGGLLSGPSSGYQVPGLTFHGREHVVPGDQLERVENVLIDVKDVLLAIRNTAGDQNKTNKKLYSLLDNVSQGNEYLQTKAV